MTTPVAAGAFRSGGSAPVLPATSIALPPKGSKSVGRPLLPWSIVTSTAQVLRKWSTWAI